jgi:hypothetical protein
MDIEPKTPDNKTPKVRKCDECGSTNLEIIEKELMCMKCASCVF